MHVLHNQNMKMEPEFWTFRQKKLRINAFKSFKDYPFPGKVANLKILFRQRYLSAAPWWCKRSHWIFVKGPTLLIGMAFIFGKVSWKKQHHRYDQITNIWLDWHLFLRSWASKTNWPSVWVRSFPTSSFSLLSLIYAVVCCWE